MKRRIEFRFERHQKWRAERIEGSTHAFCPHCRQNVLLVQGEQAARMVRIGARLIYRWIEAEEVHFLESDDGSVLVCLKSVRERMREKLEEGG